MILYIVDDNFPPVCTLLYPNPKILFFMKIEIGKRPSSPYNIICEVLNFFYHSQISKPQTSHPYVRIGKIVLSNNFSWQSIGKHRFLFFLIETKYSLSCLINYMRFCHCKFTGFRKHDTEKFE